MATKGVSPTDGAKGSAAALNVSVGDDNAVDCALDHRRGA